jgi:hypothetical protein
MRRIILAHLLPLGLLAAPPAAIGQDASRVRLDAPLYTRGGMPACTTTDALAGYFSALRGVPGSAGSGVSVYGCLLLQEGAAADLVGQDNGAYRIRVVHPGTGDIYPVELWTTLEGLRNALGRQPGTR